jgi:UDP-N-acetylglucosamine 2-epimerase (non-hydrolysing)
VVVVGARPNFVKVSPILTRLRQCKGVKTVLVHTGQHHDDALSGSFFRDLDIPEPDVHLSVTSDTAPARLAEMIGRLAPIFSASRPDLVLVVGDVDSTLAGALAAAKSGIPIAHVEAGLRSFDRTMPEEVNRVLTDSIAEYCFTTEPSANRNLAREGVPPDRIHHVGNVMIDTLFRLRARAATSRILDTCGLAAREYAVLTLHRPSNVDDVSSLLQVLGAIASVSAEVPVVFPVHPRTRGRLDALPTGSAAMKGLRLLEPLPYLDFVRLMEGAAAVLTDSGGIQEETTALGVPCLTLRDSTERPITTTHGTNEVVGVSPQRIAAAWTRIRRGRWRAGRLPALWDGHAAERIVDVLTSNAGIAGSTRARSRRAARAWQG